uniref:(northern house mosquito) hypothetical protein n=1 Tax=Culex pipiens TaxID=7175 RepID=A0A8D8IND1_CULPI
MPMPSSELENEVVRGPRITISLVVPLALLLILMLLPRLLLLLLVLLLLVLLLLLLFGGVECPSSLSGGDVEPVLHEVLLLPELVPRMVSQPGADELGEQDRLISTRAALHSSVGSSSLIL